MQTFLDSKKLAKEKNLEDTFKLMDTIQQKTQKEEEKPIVFSDNFQGSVCVVS